MKTPLLALCMIFALGTASAQNTVELLLTPLYDGQPLNIGQTYTDPNGYAFEITRLQFYAGQFTITHDGGQTTDFNGVDNYILTDAGTTSYTIGTGNVTSVEDVSFYIGVENSLNHADPALQATGHPLALQSPSMHWGWASGYRFLAVELEVDTDGNGSMDALMESHVVGDNFLTQVTSVGGINSSTVNGNTVSISLNYDLKNWLNGIDISTAGFNHGGGPINAAIMANTDPQNVFSESGANSIQELDAFKVELIADAGQIRFTSDMNLDEIELFDTSGRVVHNAQLNAKQGTLAVPVGIEGILLVRLRSGNAFVTKKIRL